MLQFADTVPLSDTSYKMHSLTAAVASSSNASLALMHVSKITSALTVNREETAAHANKPDANSTAPHSYDTTQVRQCAQPHGPAEPPPSADVSG